MSVNFRCPHSSQMIYSSIERIVTVLNTKYYYECDQWYINPVPSHIQLYPSESHTQGTNFGKNVPEIF